MAIGTSFVITKKVGVPIFPGKAGTWIPDALDKHRGDFGLKQSSSERSR
jgi:hypothetical protein